MEESSVNEEKIISIEIERLKDFKNHPFRVRSDRDMQKLLASIKQYGMWGVFAEMERGIISQRVKSGMRNAAAKGKQIGRPKTTTENIPAKFWKYYSRYKTGDFSVSEIARLMDFSRTTVYKYIDMVERQENSRRVCDQDTSREIFVFRGLKFGHIF